MKKKKVTRSYYSLSGVKKFSLLWGVNLVILFFFLKGAALSSQIIPSLESLNYELIAIHSKNMDAEITAFKIPNTFNWVYFMPNLGYDFINQNPYLTISLSGITGLINQKKRNKQKRLSIVKKGELRLITDLYNLKIKYENVNDEIQKFAAKISLFNDYKDLYSIKENQYLNKEITTENWIIEKIKIKEKVALIEAYTNKIEKLIEEIKWLIKKEIKVQLPKFNLKGSINEN
jgi:hypothetical protein